MQVFKFKEEVMEFLASLCSHAMETSLLQSFFPRCLKCLSPNFMVESSRSCELMFEKILLKSLSLINSYQVVKLMQQNLSFQISSQLQ